MNVAIVGIGTWLPEATRSNDAWPPEFSERVHARGDRTFNDIPPSDDPVAAAILARDLEAEARDPFLGAKVRHVASDRMTAAEAEVQAGLAALRDAGLSPGDVDLVISSSNVPDRLLPTAATAVAHRIGADRALGLGIDVACAGSVVQLDIARAYIMAGLAQTALLVQSHLLLRTIAMEHPASPGLGDGASAMVVTRGSGLQVRSTFAVSQGEHAMAVTWVRGIDDSSDLPWWKAGCEFRLGSRDPARAKVLMRDTVTFGAATIREAARRGDVDVSEIDAIASVQPRGFMPHAIAERLGVPRERAVTTYEQIAHVGVCGPVFNLARARALGRCAPGKVSAMYGQGAGFTRAAAILEA